MENEKSHDEKILSHIKWASNLIFEESQKIDKKSNDALEFILKRNPSFDDLGPIRFYRFKYPLGNLEKDGIRTSLSKEIRIWQEKEFEYIEKPRSWFGEIKITGDKVKSYPEEYFVLNIVDKNRKLLKTIKGSSSSRPFPESYSYYETPLIEIVLRERPRKDSREREVRVGKRRVYPIKDYIFSFQGRTGLIPIMIPKSLKEERWTKVARGRCEIFFFREKPKRKRSVDHSYSPLDFYIQIGIYSIQTGLLTDMDCFIKDFRQYISEKNPKRYPKNNVVLKKALQYIVNSYFLPYHSGTFDAYAKRTASALLNRRTAVYYQPKINPEKEERRDIRQYIIKMRMQERPSNKETAKRWLSRKLKNYSLNEIYVDRRYLD